MSGNEVTIVIGGKNASGTAIEDAKKGVKGLGDEVDKTGRKTTAAGEAVSSFERLVGNKMRLGQTAVSAMGEEYERLTRRVRELRAELAKPGASPAVHADLKAAMKDLDGLRQIGKDAGVELTKGVSLGIKAGGPYMIAGLAGLAVAAAPAIGATVSAAVLGGLGAGGLIGGIALAARDPRVKAAGEAFSEQAFRSLDRAALPFVEQTIGALGVLGDAVDHIADQAGPSLNRLAGEIAPLVNGITQMAENALPGLIDGLDSAAPVLRAVSNSLPRIGEALGSFFESVSEDPDGAVMAIEGMTEAVADTIEVTGDLIADLTQMYEWSVNAGASVTGVFEDIFHWLSLVAPQFEVLSAIMGHFNDDFERQAAAVGEANQEWPRFSTNLDEVAGSAAEVEKAMRGMKDAVDDAFDKVLGIHEQTIQYEQGLRSMKEELLDGAKSLSIHSEEGLKNRDAMIDQIRETQNLRQANIDSGMSAADANRIYEDQIVALEKWAIKNGYTAAQVRELTRAVLNVPSEAETEFKFPGLLRGIRDVQALARLTGSLASAAAVRAGGDGVGGRAHGGIIGAASGGARGGMTWVGEQGPELVRLPYGSTVIPNGTSEAMAAAGGGGAREVRLIIDLRNATNEVANLIRKIVNVEGGGDVSVAFGKASR